MPKKRAEMINSLSQRILSFSLWPRNVAAKYAAAVISTIRFRRRRVAHLCRCLACVRSPRANPSQVVQRLKERTAIFILKNLRHNRQLPWCRKMLDRLTLPPTVHHHGPYRVWQRRFYDLNVWSEKKRLEKLNYMHANPVKRGVVTSPEQWLGLQLPLGAVWVTDTDPEE